MRPLATPQQQHWRKLCRLRGQYRLAGWQQQWQQQQQQQQQQ
jgi:hypothetical protein